jgi:hypothetical protein
LCRRVWVWCDPHNDRVKGPDYFRDVTFRDQRSNKRVPVRSNPLALHWRQPIGG